MYLRIFLKASGKKERGITGNNAKKNIRGFARVAMNTTHTIFDNKITPYTAVGGMEHGTSSGISAVILNRQGHYPRRSLFQELEKAGFDHVISIESPSPHYDIEELTGRFPFVRFVLPEREINLGEQINIAAREIKSPLFFVLRNDLKIVAGGLAKRMAERLSEIQEQADENVEKKISIKRLCTVPVIVNSRYEILPTLVTPMIYRKIMQTALMQPQMEGQFSIFPFDGIGIYDRERFIQTGGFDTTLKNTHWQLMDFGFRAHLWGEKIALSLQLRVLCEGELIAQDKTVEQSYRRFYLRNIAPVFNGSYAHLPLYRLLPFFAKSGEDIFTAWQEFFESRKWVADNKRKWRYGVHDITNLWDKVNTNNDVNIEEEQEIS